MNERRLWAAAARVIMEDAARIIRAARKQERGLRRNNTNYVVTKGEEVRQLAYFDSADWRTVCACAGIDVSAEQSKRAVLAMAAGQQRVCRGPRAARSGAPVSGPKNGGAVNGYDQA